MTVHSGDEVEIVQHLLCSAEINLQLCRALAVLPTFQQLPLPRALYPGHPFVTKGNNMGYQAVKSCKNPIFLGTLFSWGRE
jgi:hypothetical protein